MLATATPTISQSLGAMGGAANVQSSAAAGNSTYTPPTGATTINAGQIGTGSNLSSYTPATTGTASNTLGATVNSKVAGALQTQPQPITGDATTPNGTVVNATTGNTTTPAPSTTTPTTTDTSSSGGILDYLKSLIGIDATKGDVTQEDQNQEDLSGKTQAASDASTALTSAKAGLAAQIAQIQSDPTLTKAQAAANVAEVTRTGNQNLANLSIILDAANNNVTAANTIISQKVSAQFDSVEANIKNMESLYTLSQNDMSDSEKMQAQAKIDAAKTATANLQSAYSDALKTATANGAPADVLAAIDKAASDPNATSAGIDAAAGKYLNSNLQAYNNAYAAAAGKAAADAQSGVLTPAQNTVINSATTALDGSQTVKDYQQIASQYAVISSIPEGTTDPVLQNNLLLAIAQIYVPGAKTVRGVLSAIPASGMQSGIWNALNSADKTITAKGSLSGATVNALKTQADTIYSQSYSAYNAIRSSFVTSAVNRGITNADQYIPNYSTIGGAPTSSSGGSTVTKGTSGTINGKTYTYNGTGDTSDIKNWTLQP